MPAYPVPTHISTPAGRFAVPTQRPWQVQAGSRSEREAYTDENQGELVTPWTATNPQLTLRGTILRLPQLTDPMDGDDDLIEGLYTALNREVVVEFEAPFPTHQAHVDSMTFTGSAEQVDWTATMTFTEPPAMATEPPPEPI